MTMDEPEKITVCDGKYTLIMDPGNLRALRYGEPWRDLCGDKFVMALGHEILDLISRLEQAERKASLWEEAARLRGARDEATIARLVAALKEATQHGCPACHGDCSTAIPPIQNCPMRAAREALGPVEIVVVDSLTSYHEYLSKKDSK